MEAGAIGLIKLYRTLNLGFLGITMRSNRNPNTRTRIVPNKKRMSDDPNKEIREAIGNFHASFKDIEVADRWYSLDQVRTQERLYGTAYGSGRYNEGLGEKTYGKDDFLRKAEAKGLVPVGPGVTQEERKRTESNSRKNRVEQERIVKEAVSKL